MTTRAPSRIRRTGAPFGVLDIGTSKVVCLIGALERGGPEPGAPLAVTVLGAACHRSLGVKAGVVTDLDQAEIAVREAVGQAERMAGLALESVHLSVACGRIRSAMFTARAEIGGAAVSDDDIARLVDGARAYTERDGRSLVHMNRLGFAVDATTGIRDPRGMAGSLLAGQFHAVTADDTPVRNLMKAAERCHLPVAALVVAPYAAALAATSADERRLGVTCIDIGGGTTTIASFLDGQLVNVDALPVGGNLLTYDVAGALQTTLAEAERIKVLYGTLVEARSDARDGFAFPLAAVAGEMGRSSRAEIRECLRPRVASLLEFVGEKLARARLPREAMARVVLTGGGSSLVGLGDWFARGLGRPVRVAGPDGIAGLPGSVSGPAFAVAAGLFAAASRQSTGVPSRRATQGPAGGYLERVGHWLAEGF